MLELDWTTILFEIVNFVILVVLLNRFLFQPVLRRVREQAERKAQLLAQTEQARAEAEQLRLELDAKMATADEEADAIVAAARQSAETEHDAILQRAYRQADAILHETRAESEQLRANLLLQHEKALVDTVLDVSRSVLHNATPDDVHNRLIQQLHDEIWRLGTEDMARVQAVRQSLGEREPLVEVHAARPLSIAQQGMLARAFTALADREVQLAFTTEPRLGAGLRVRLGDLVVENTLGNQIDRLRADVGAELEARLGAGERQSR
jgi:F-type H+-transporting ATPase subunit b